jgi:hypothetical protein
MRVGEFFRYSATYDPAPPQLDGLRNYFHVVAQEGHPLPLLSRGISPVGSVRTPGGPRIPAVLIRSTPHKVGTATTPWEDFFDVDVGHIRYFGDNKSPELRPEEAPGNRSLLGLFPAHSARAREDRARAVPLLFFRGVAHGGRIKGNVEFLGFGLIERVQLATQWDRENRRYFTNHRFDFAVLGMAAENESFDWRWIWDRGDSSRDDAGALRLAPESWRHWVSDGPGALARLKRNVARMRVVRTKDQIPAKGTPEWRVLESIYSHYKGAEIRFEQLAATVAERVLRSDESRYRHGWISRASGDGGWDFVGRLDIGSGFARTRLVVLGQAKCERVGIPTGGQAIARTVARLKRGWVGVYVTTSCFSEPVQEEVIEDQYPLVLIHGLRLAQEVLGILAESGTDLDGFLASIDAAYQVEPRRPEEILLQD